MPLQFNDRKRGVADVKDDDFRAVHDDCGHIPGVLLVPAEADQGGVRLGALVDDGGVLLVTKIEDADGAVGGDGCKDTDSAPGDVVYLLIVSNELGVDDFAIYVPDGAGGIDAGGADALGLGVVPVEGGEGTAEVAVLVSVEEALKLDAVVVGDPPHTEEIAGGCEKVGFLALLVRDKDGLGGRVGMLKGEIWIGADLTVGVVQLNDLHAVWVLFQEAGYSQPVLLVAADTPVHGIDVPRCLVRVYLRPLLLLVRTVLIRIAARPHIPVYCLGKIVCIRAKRILF
ncbi:hypothetical protein F2P56_000068 [Juglans regia]|uniref:Uncharacterized protein n=1 Tax=Juglans regia TaxID=51240 RepID=A0A833YA36_JUGRE|nr:hypothetical protein F2P56_000068 [Juglans regia]